MGFITGGLNLIFLYKVKDGGVSDSHGISVAKLAGVKKSIIKRANEGKGVK